MNDVERGKSRKKIPKLLKKVIDFGGACCHYYQVASEGLLKEVVFMGV